MKFRSRLAALLLLACFPLCASSQTVPVGSNNLSGTIGTTNTFQVVQGQTNNRVGCTIQNKSAANNMYVYFDKTNSSGCSAATQAPAAQLQPGQSANCGVAGGAVLKDQVCITGTAGDTFYANFQ